ASWIQGICHTPWIQQRRLAMEFTRIPLFAHFLFDSEPLANKATTILAGMLAAQSPRLSRISQYMPGSAEANYKQIPRFLCQADPQAALQRRFQAAAPA